MSEHRFNSHLSLGFQMVIREQYRDDVADGQFQENRQLFADNKGRYVIHMCRILYLTNDNHFRDDIRSLVFPQ